MPRRPDALRATAVLGAAGLTFAGWYAAAGTRPEADPAGWSLSAAPASMELPELAGELRPSPTALDLWDRRAAAPRDWRFPTGSIELVARIPDGAELDVILGSPLGNVGPVAPNAPAVRGLEVPPIDDRDGSDLRVRFDRLRHRTTGTGALRCAPGPEVGERASVRISLTTSVLEVTSAGTTLLHCEAPPVAPQPPVFASGIRRVQLESITFTPTSGTAWTARFGAPWRTPVGGLGAALLGAVVGALVPRRYALAFVPGLVAAGLVLLRWRGLLDGLRLLAVPEALGPLLAGGLVSVAMFVVLGARGGLVRAVVVGLLPALALAPTLALGYPDASGWVLGAVAFLPLALAAEGSRRRGSPLLLQALLLTLFPVLELAARQTRLDHDWSYTQGFARAQKELDQLLVQRRYNLYPIEGFPVRPPERTPGKRRIVALGGSSTGGAFQMDNLDLFWPKRLDERLAGTGWEVVNQAVGGWNTALIRLYLESQLDRLEPDVLALYVGHNDLFTQSAVRYRDYIAQYRAAGAGGASSPLLDTLRGFRLYNGLKYALLAARDGGAPTSVPIDDARDNLTAILQLATAHHAKVLLMTEAIQPDPTLLDGYAAMEAEVAATSPDAAYFDANQAMFALDDPDAFLDDCHLSVSGHGKLAELVEDALRRAGWLTR